MPFQKGHKINVGKKFSLETKKKISLSKLGRKFPAISLAKKGHAVTPEARQKISQSLQGYIPWNKGKKDVYSESTKEKMRKTRQSKEYRESRSGENHHNWKGGATPETKKIRNSLEMRLWREAVFKRDNWTCIWCFEKGRRLEADHIKRFADYPELRFAIDNGRTLCIECHKKTDTYGGKKQI